MKHIWSSAALALILFAALPAFALEYTVRRGDTLGRIARNHGLSIAELKAANGLRPGSAGDLIHPGQVLQIPEFEADGSSADGLPTPTQRYTVIRGDSISKIARRFGTSVTWIKSNNGLTSDIIHPAQVLVVPGFGAAVAAASETMSDEERFTVYHVPRSATSAELEVLARIVKGETPETVPFEGQVAVAAVVLNRVRSTGFPNTITGVAHQRKQFSCYNPDVRSRLYMGKIPDYAWRAARAALEGQDPTSGCTYYFNPYLVVPSWARRFDFVRRIGKTRTTTHDFYRVKGATVTARRTPYPPEPAPFTTGMAGRVGLFAGGTN